MFRLQRYPSDENAKPILIPRKDIAWEASAVFNPSVVYDNDIFRMLYRTYPEELGTTTPKYYRPGFKLSNQKSYIGYAESKDGINFERRKDPFIAPDQSFDMYGCEDPRVTKFDNTFYITYTAIDAPLGDKTKKPNIRIALASTKDFITIVKHGIVGPPVQSKAAALFPELINNGKIGLAMTISSDSSTSHVAIRYYNSIDELLNQTDDSWKEFLSCSKEKAVLKTHWWLERGPELGATPIKTDRGWLFIYSAESMAYVWTITAALVDLHEPHKLIARIPSFLLQPVTLYEREGIVPEVTFPEGAVIVGSDLYVYYGCADTVIGLATCKLNELLDYIESFKQ